MKFLQIMGSWVNRYFSNEEAVYLISMLAVCFVALFTLGGVLAPVLTGLVIAFLLQGLVSRLTALRMPHFAAVLVAFTVFLGTLIATLLFLVPLLWRQLQALVSALPGLVERLRSLSIDLPESIANYVTPQQIDAWLAASAGEIGNLSGTLIETTLAQVPGLVGLLIYLVLVPISVFFFLLDRQRILDAALALLPSERPLLNRVGGEMNLQLANYVRGKAIEILIVGATSYVAFQWLGLNYAALLALLVGLSVLVPFIGAAVVTIPVAVVGLIQFGWSADFAWLMIAYAIIQALDGNVLVPLLFAEAVNLHPIAIIVAVLAFGGLWGLWGVFFAIPLATLIKAIWNAWPSGDELDEEDHAGRGDAIEPDGH